MSTQVFHEGRGPDARRVQLGTLLGEGAAGKVYAVRGRKGVAAKLYHPEEVKTGRDRERKIDAMLVRPPQLASVEHEGVAYPQIAWPLAKLYDRDGQFAGFLMPEIDFSRSTSLVNLLQRSSRRAEGLSDYYGYRVLVARNLASVFVQLHGAGHHMIDMKPANLRFYPALSWMAVVDADGFSIAGKSRRLPAEQMSDEYIAPESWNRKPAELGEAQDLFALAVIIFQLLNNGMHPFAGSGSEDRASDLQGRILAGLYGYGLTRTEGVRPGTASIHKTFRRSTRMFFDRAFAGTGERPTAAEWRDHLDALVGMLIPCEAKPLEHAHFGAGCGFCAHEARLVAMASGQSKRRRPARVARPVPAPSRGVPRGIPVTAGAGLGHHRRSAARRRGAGPLAQLVLPVLALAGFVAGAATIARSASQTDEISVWDRLVEGEARRLAQTMQVTAPTGEEDAPLPGSVAAAARDAGGVQAGTRPRAEQAAACGELASWIEQRLCATPELARADRQVEIQYARASAQSTGWSQLALAEDHLRWLERHGRCALMPDPDPCLLQSYAERLDALRDRRIG